MSKGNLARYQQRGPVALLTLKTMVGDLDDASDEQLDANADAIWLAQDIVRDVLEACGLRRPQ